MYTYICVYMYIYTHTLTHTYSGLDTYWTPSICLPRTSGSLSWSNVLPLSVDHFSVGLPLLVCDGKVPSRSIRPALDSDCLLHMPPVLSVISSYRCH